MRLSNNNLELIRTRPQSTRLHLSIFSPRAVFACRVNDAGIQKGERTIAYNSVTQGSYLDVEAGMLMLVGTSAGNDDVGRVRIKSVDALEFEVAENSDINWENLLYITVLRYWRVEPVYPRIISDPSDSENVIFFKDYDIPYVNQNSILGTLINMGSHRAGFIENGQGMLWYTSSGTHSLHTGTILSYDWAFEGGTPTGSTSATPGWVTYSQPGDYVTRLIVSGSNGSVDRSYRYVSMYNPINSGTSIPYINWEMQELAGSRDEGGYHTQITIYQFSDEVEEGSVVVLFSDDYYGSNHTSLGGNGENNSKIFFVGYVLGDSIQYDYQKSTVTFDISSISGYMKEMDGFSISVESTRTPAYWYQILDLDIPRGIYHFLRWQSTVLSTVDVEYTGEDLKLQYFDADRTSLYDAVDSFARSTLPGKMVSDRQGKLWVEQDITLQETGTVSSVMEITRRDWMNSPSIEESVKNKSSYLEMGGIYFSGSETGTFSALMACAPGETPAYRGRVERTQGLALSGQEYLNRIVANRYAHANSRIQSVGMELSGNYQNIDIAPQEPLHIRVLPEDTVRRINVDGDFNADSMSWRYSPKDGLLLPTTTLSPIVNGEHYEVIVVPDVPDSGGFSIPAAQVPNLPALSIPALFNNFSGLTDALFLENFDADSGDSFYMDFDIGSYKRKKGTNIDVWDNNGHYIEITRTGIYTFSILVEVDESTISNSDVISLEGWSNNVSTLAGGDTLSRYEIVDTSHKPVLAKTMKLYIETVPSYLRFRFEDFNGSDFPSAFHSTLEVTRDGNT